MTPDKIVMGVGALAIGYLVLSRKGEEGGGGAGGAGVFDEEEDLGSKLDNALGQIPIIINIPALPGETGDDGFRGNDWSPGPVPDPIPEPGKDGKGFFDTLIDNTIKAVGSSNILKSFIEPKKGYIPTDAAGMPKKSSAKIHSEKFWGNVGGGIKSFFAVKTPLADRGIGRSGTSIKSSKGRTSRVEAWKKKYGEPSYSGTGHRVKV